MNRPAPKFAHVGRRRRFSFVTRDAKTGVVVRRWHDAMVAALPAADGSRDVARSLRGMVAA